MNKINKEENVIFKNAIKKGKRNMITLKQKLDIIRRYELGYNKSKIARLYGINESTIRTILKRKEEYKEKSKITSPTACLQTIKTRSIRMIKMERLLSIWLEDCHHKKISQSISSIKEKALSIFLALGDQKGEKDFFTASKGWFERLKTRIGLQKVRVGSEYIWELPHLPPPTNDHLISLEELDSEVGNLHESIDIKTSDDNFSDEENKCDLDFEENKCDLNFEENKCDLNLDENKYDLNFEENICDVKTEEIGVEDLQEIFQTIAQFKKLCMEADPNLERSTRICEDIENAISCYRQIYEEKTNFIE